MSEDLGQRAIGSTVDFKFSSIARGQLRTLAGSPAVKVYKAGTATPIATGVTFTGDYNSTVGLNDVSIVASVANGYASGFDYEAVITSGTLDSVSMVGAVVARFSLL